MVKNGKLQAFRLIMLTSAIAVMIGLNGCFYDNEMELYPEIPGCDTTNVTYSVTISAIMSGNCNACHSGSAPQANIKTDNYADLKTIADDGRLPGVIKHESGFPAMPKDRPKLSECDITKITIWINRGALNN